MPIHQITNLATVAIVPPIGAILANRARSHFASLIQARIGIGSASCQAALAIEVHPEYPSVALLGGAHFAIVYGSSRFCHMHGGDRAVAALNRQPDSWQDHNSLSMREQHAEQVAIGVAVQNLLPRHVRGGTCHIWTTFPPCHECQTIFYPAINEQYHCYHGFPPPPPPLPKKRANESTDKDAPSGTNGKGTEVAADWSNQGAAKKTKIGSS